MAVNKLTPQLDLLTRDFFVAVANDKTYLTDSPAHRRQLMAILLEALNYTVLPNGSFVATDTKVVVEFGSKDYSAYPDEWAEDKWLAIEAGGLDDATTDNQDTTEASPSSESESTEVREGILPEDVR